MSSFAELEKLKASLELLKADNRKLRNEMTTLKYKNISLKASIEAVDLNNLLKIQKDLQDKIDDTKNLQTKAKIALDYVTSITESTKQKMMAPEPTASHSSDDTLTEENLEQLLAEHKEMEARVKQNRESIRKIFNVTSEEEEEELFIPDSQEA